MLQLTNADVGFASGAKSANLHPKIEHFRRPDDDTLARIIQLHAQQIHPENGVKPMTRFLSILRISNNSC